MNNLNNHNTRLKENLTHLETENENSLEQLTQVSNTWSIDISLSCTNNIIIDK